MDALLTCQEGITRRPVEAISNRKKRSYVKEQIYSVSYRRTFEINRTVVIQNFNTAHQDNALFEQFPELVGPKVTVEFTKPTKPNIVLIYAESLGQRYFDETVFPDLVPNLKTLRAQSIDFTNVAQGVGAGWTVAGIVASQCGYPLAESHEVGGNDLGLFNEFLPAAVCLGDLLEQDGYHLAFVGGADSRFAGKGNFLRAHGYNEILDRRELTRSLADKSYAHEWGVFDDSLFSFSIRKFLSLSSREEPFLLTLLTLDTHHPNGFLSRSCGPYGEGNNSSLDAVHCSDQLISGFIEQIRNSPYSDNSIVVVVSDHLAMRNQASALLATSKNPKRLTFFVNTPDGRREKNANAGLHYDIAPTILDIAGYRLRGQMGFGVPLTRGSGYLPGKFGEAEWERQSGSLMAVGRTLWNNEVTLDQTGIRLIAANLSLVMGAREFNLRSDGSSDVPESILFLFDDKSLKLEKIEPFPFDQGLNPTTLSRELLLHKDKLALVISRAGNLPGFADLPDPNRWAFFFGKPGSDVFSWGPVAGDLFIPYDLIRELSRGKMDDEVVREREKLLKAVDLRLEAVQEG